jgi:hypothetical protein
MSEFLGVFREGIDVMGRPDHNCYLPEEKQWWWTEAKTFKPLVHGSSHNCCLVHKVARVKLRWYDGYYSYMRRRDHPCAIAETVCGQYFFLNVPKKGAKMCELPAPDAVQCGRCNGELPTFSKRRKVQIKRQWAKDHLACVVTA